MKNLHFIVALLFLCQKSIAQQPAHYSLYVLNPLPYNPALTADREAMTLNAQYRNQWLRLEGAPQTAHLNFQMPFGEGRNGVALALTADRIGMTAQNSLTASYAYRFKINEKMKLGLGLQAAIDQFRIAWEKARPLDQDDTEIPTVAGSSAGANFGFGAHLVSELFYVGLSMPQLMPTKLYSDEFVNQQGPGAVQNRYLMGGFNIVLSEKFRLLPSTLLVYNRHQPLKWELGAQILWEKKLGLGANMRFRDALNAFLMYKINQNFRAGFAWDFTTSQLRRVNSGSFEMLVGYQFGEPAENTEGGLGSFRFF